MRQYVVRHETRYGYRAPVDIGLHVLRLTPLNIGGQQVVRHGLVILPEPTRMEALLDHFGNTIHHIAVETMHDQFIVTLDAQVDVTRRAVSEDGPSWEEIRKAMRDDGFPRSPGTAEFVYPSPLALPDDAVTAYTLESFPEGRHIIPALRDLAGRIHDDFAYTPNLTNIATSVVEVLSLRRGVCQDFAHLMIAGLRGLGLPARYVSGYVYNRPVEGQAARPGSDASHAWVSVWCGEELGWAEFDPTNNLRVENEHIVLAYGRDFQDATPLRGVILGGGSHTLKVAVEVRNLDASETSPPHGQSGLPNSL